MPKSMTGFSKVEMESGEGKCYGEARSLNSRYLEISLKLPRSASGYESRLRETAKRVVKRGRLDITIKWDKGDEYGVVPKANEEAIRWYVDLAAHLKESYGLKGDTHGQRPYGLQGYPGLRGEGRSRKRPSSPASRRSLRS